MCPSASTLTLKSLNSNVVKAKRDLKAAQLALKTRTTELKKAKAKAKSKKPSKVKWSKGDLVNFNWADTLGFLGAYFNFPTDTLTLTACELSERQGDFVSMDTTQEDFRTYFTRAKLSEKNQLKLDNYKEMDCSFVAFELGNHDGHLELIINGVSIDDLLINSF
jgi:hypothetical protein